MSPAIRLFRGAILSPQSLLSMTGISKSFPGVTALSDVSFALEAGEVVALLGENGAGKSTLIKMLGGAHQPDDGEIRIDGAPVTLNSPSSAYAAGIGVIYQELNLVPELTASENIFLGRETRSMFVARWSEQQRSLKLFEQLGVEIPTDVPCGSLSIARQQLVEIAKALSQHVRLLVMDEPSAALTPQEVERLFAIINDLKSRGIGIVYISHRLDEIFAVADRVVVLRDGTNVGESPIGKIQRAELIEWMVGRDLEHEYPASQRIPGEERLTVRNLSRSDSVNDVSFSIRRGEIVGLTGLVGAGRTETARLLFGADVADGGTIELDGHKLRINSPRDAIHAGICLLTEDRKSQGLVLDATVRHNFGLPNLATNSSFGFVNGRKESEQFGGYVDSLRIRIPHQDQLAKNLSGGNQQKVVLAKWLERNAEVVIFDEPTRGIDVGTRYDIYLLMNELAAQGKSILMISSELPEVLGMSDRILVMHAGRIVGEINDVSASTQVEIMEMAVGK